MVSSISMYRGNLHRAGADTDHRWPAPRPTITPSRFRSLLRSRTLSLARLDGAARADSAASSSTSRLADGDAGVDEEEQDEEGMEMEEEEEEEQEQEQEEEDGQNEQQPQEAGEEQDEGAVEDADMDDAGEVLVGGEDAHGNGDAQEGQGESEGFDPNPEVSTIKIPRLFVLSCRVCSSMHLTII